MHLVGRAGVAIHLEPLHWQYPPSRGRNSDSWDDKWLVIAGQADLAGELWSFVDPCLLMEEARELTTWLRAAAEGRIEPDNLPSDEDQAPSLSFLEPALGFSVAARSGDEFGIRVHFAAEAAPSRLCIDEPHLARRSVNLQIPSGQLLAAADDWNQALDALPARPWMGPG